MTSYSGCPGVYFEIIGDLPGDCISATPEDISSDGVRVVVASSADDPGIPNDGGSCDPWLGWPHSNEAAGWTRPCKNIPFFTPPANGEGGLIGLGYLLSGNPSHHESLPRGISPDGKIVVGYSNYTQENNVRAVVFREDGAVGLAVLDAGCMAYDVSQPSFFPSFLTDQEMNGRIIVGYSNTTNNYSNRAAGARAIYWDDWDHVVSLPYPADSLLPNGEKIISSDAVSISDDGKIIAGNLYYDKKKNPQHLMSYSCAWIYRGSVREGGYYEFLDILEDIPGGDDCSTTGQVSGNGLVIVGRGSQTVADVNCWYNPQKACKWVLTSTEYGDAACSPPEILHGLQGFESCSAYGVNYDGSVIAGVAYYAIGECPGQTFIDNPVLWRGDHAARPPEDLSVILAPLVPQGLVLYTADRVSADGLTVLGLALDADWNPITWIAGLPAKAVPVSNWALFIGAGLMVLLIGWRIKSRP